MTTMNSKQDRATARPEPLAWAYDRVVAERDALRAENAGLARERDALDAGLCGIIQMGQQNERLGASGPAYWQDMAQTARDARRDARTISMASRAALARGGDAAERQVGT